MTALPKSAKNGFTLVELLLVVALLAITVGVTGDILLSIVRTYNKTQVINEIEQQSNFIALKLDKELRNAQGAEVVSGNLVITTRETNTDITYSLTDGVLYRQEGSSGPNLPLTKQDLIGGVEVQCNGTCFSVTGVVPAVVSYSFTFTQHSTGSGTDPAFTGSTDISNTIVIRNTY